MPFYPGRSISSVLALGIPAAAGLGVGTTPAIPGPPSLVTPNALGAADRAPPVGRITPDAIFPILGSPYPRPNLVDDRIVSDIVMLPYRGPLDVTNYGGETWAMRQDYRYQYLRSPILRAALNTGIAAVSCLDPNVMPGQDGPFKGDRKRKALAREVADFINYSISEAPGGFLKVFEDVYGAARVDGYSICAKKLKAGVPWRGRELWGFDHTRQLDTNWIRLQLDVYRNPVAIVNMVRGLEYYTPEQVILYTHNGMYCNPFGQSDCQSVVGAANVIEDAYKAWLVAVTIYGLPYMHGKYDQPAQKQAMQEILANLRAYGWAVTSKQDEIEVLNLAAAAGTTMFQDLVHIRREDVFFGTRGAAQPFMEGDGGSDAHTDTEVQRAGSDALEYRDARRVADVVRNQLFKPMTVANFGSDAPVPLLTLGGTNWEEIGKIIESLSKVKKELGKTPEPEWIQKVISIPFLDEDESAEEKQSGTSPDAKDNVSMGQAIASLQGQCAAGTISPEACVANVVTCYGFDPARAAKLFPPPKPQPAQPAGTPSTTATTATSAAQPPTPEPDNVEPTEETSEPTDLSAKTFSESHKEDDWESVAEEMVRELEGSKA